MSKGSKSRSKTARKSKKAAAKSARKAQYKAWAVAGITKGSKRQSIKKKKLARSAKDYKHEVTVCTNIGCAHCREQAMRTRRIIIGPPSPRQQPKAA